MRRLAALIKERNRTDAEIAGVIGRPAHPGHIAEFVAAEIFGIELLESASHKGIDGHFVGGPLDGGSVNVKYYSKREGLLDMTLDAPPDFYLALTGPKTAPASSRGTTRPWVVESTFLFSSLQLVRQLRERGVKIGTAASVAGRYWDEAEIYPCAANPAYEMTNDQRRMIEMFKSEA